MEAAIYHKGPFILGIDVGTSSTKAAIYSLDGNEQGFALAEYPTIYPYSTWAEQEAEQWWHAVLIVVKNLLEKSCVKPGAIKVISISGQAPTCLPIDKEGRPIRPAIIWIDRRATDEVAWIEKHIGVDIVHRISGNTIDGYFGGLKWLWFRNKEPVLFNKTWKILQAHSYIIYKLCGEVVTDFSQAGLCSPCFDLINKKWSLEMCKALDIPIRMLPELAPSYQIVGKIHSEGARASGLKAGTPIVAGGGDFACATLGCGVIEIGQAAQMLGTAGNLIVPMGKSINPDPRLLNTLHVTGDYLTIGSIFAGGVIQWFRDQLGEIEVTECHKTGKSAYTLLDEGAAKIPPGADNLLMLPYLMGERTPIWDVFARGVFIGLTPMHTRAHMYRAVLEGVAFAFRHMVEIIERQGVQIKDIVAGDGGARSAVWRQIFADILNARIHHNPASSVSLLGDVVLAGVGAGYFAGFEIVRQWQKIVESQEPDIHKTALYNQYYLIYRRTYDQLKDIFYDLSRIGK